MKKFLIGYQLYSARREAYQDMPGTLKAIKALGYDGVELAGFLNHSASEVQAALNAAGLIAFSAHVPYDEIIADMDKVIKVYQGLGCKFLAVPYLDDKTRPGSPAFSTVCRNIRTFGEKCAAAGLTLLYHNHDFEFVQVSGQYGLDFLYDLIPEAYLQTELDTCWVKYAGEDPAQYILKYQDRAPVIHLKDYVGRRGGESPYSLIGQAEKEHSDTEFRFTPVGHGSQNLASLLDAANQSIAQWLVVEQDESYETPALEAAKLSRDALKALRV